MGVSKNSGTPKSSMLIGFSIMNHHFGIPVFLETLICSGSRQSDRLTDSYAVAVANYNDHICSGSGSQTD